MSERMTEAMRLSGVFLVVMLALKIDGGGRFDSMSWWLIVLFSFVPAFSIAVINAVAFTLARLALFFRSR